MLDGTINLTTLKQWLEKHFKIIFNPLANILAAEIKTTTNKITSNKKKSKITWRFVKIVKCYFRIFNQRQQKTVQNIPK